MSAKGMTDHVIPVSSVFSWMSRQMHPKFWPFWKPAANLNKVSSYIQFFLDHFYQDPFFTSNNFLSVAENAASKRSAFQVPGLPTVFCSFWNLVHQLKQTFLYYSLLLRCWLCLSIGLAHCPPPIILSPTETEDCLLIFFLLISRRNRTLNFILTNDCPE